MHRNAISSTRPKRCSARDRATISLTFGLGHTRGAAPSVSIGPGAIQLTRMPFGPHSPACETVRLITPAFDAPYGSIVVDPCTPAVDEILMIEPGLFCSMNWRAADFEQKNTPSRLIPTTARHPLAERLSDGVVMLAP